MTRNLTISLILATAAAATPAWAQPQSKGHGRSSSSGGGRPVISAYPSNTPGGYRGPGGAMPAGYPGSGVPSMPGSSSGRSVKTHRVPAPSAPYSAFPYGPSAPVPSGGPVGSPWSAVPSSGKSSDYLGLMPSESPSGYWSGGTEPKSDSKNSRSSRSRQTAPGVSPGFMGMVPFGASAGEEYESAAPVQRDNRNRGKGRDTATETRPRQSLRPVQMAPGVPGEVRSADGGYFAPGQSPSDLHRQFKSSSESLKKAMSSGEKERISEQLYGIRHEAQTLRGRLRTLPLEQRLHVPSISLMYEEGTRLVEEGMRTNQESKIRMGLEKIEDANRRLGELEKR